MSLQALIDAASPGDTIQVSGDYNEASIIVVNKPLTLVGRATSSAGSRPVITITTSSSLNIAAVDVNASDVTLKGLEIVLSNTNANIDQGTIRFLAGVPADFPDQTAVPVNENLVIDDCRIVYPKNCIYNLAKNLSVTNCELHSTVTTTTTIRSVFFYHNDGESVINNVVFTTAGGAALAGVFAQHNGNNGYRNQHSGSIEFKNNQSSIQTTQRFIHLQAGVAGNNPAGSPPLSMDISDNNVASAAATTSFFLFETVSNTALEAIGQITISNNTINSAFRDGVARIARVSGGALDSFSNSPKFFIFNNTEQTNMGTSTGLVLENVLALTGYTGLPENIGDILSIVAPAAPALPPNPLVEALSLLSNGALSSTIEVRDLVGGGSNDTEVQLTKFAASAPVTLDKVFSNGSTSSTVRLVLLNADEIPYDKSLSVFPNTWRQTINSYSSPISFSIKFIDTDDLSGFVSSPGTQNYTISTPELANRAHLKVYKENSDGTVTFVTDATKVTGQSYIYSFTLSSNSVYTVADSGVMFASAGVGSDPHITTITGKHWVMPTVKGKNRDFQVLADKKHSIIGHIQGYPNGEFLSKSVIAENGKPVCEIDFQKRKIKIINDSLVKLVGKTDSSSVENSNNSNKGRQTLLINAFNPGGVLLYVDFGTRYLCPIFRQAVQNPDLKGLVI